MRKRFLFISITLFSLNANAQFFLTGTEPFSTHWKQITTINQRIIFPADAEKIAIRYANLLSVTDTITPKSLSANQKKIDVVIHNHSTLSNAFVAWAPKRMEIITQYPSSTYAQPWLTQLALHETRHTSQLFKLNGGIVKPASYLFGEMAVGGDAGFVPQWFLEGDAVAFETATSNSGRGRQASFYQYYRAHFLSKKKKFSYDKWLMGSYKDNIPNHYNLGYQMVAYAKTKYSNQVWANTLRYVSRYPFTVFPFYFGLKQQSGLSRKHLFKRAFDNLDSLWVTDAKTDNHKEYPSITKKGKEYSEYRYPYPLNDSTLIVYKTKMTDIPCFIRVDLKTKKERKLFDAGYITSSPTYFDGNIFWTEYKSHIRWEYKNYSVIKYFNLSTKRIITISSEGHYYSPVYNSIEKLVYVISCNDDGSNCIEAFDLAGKKVKKIPLPDSFQPIEISIDNQCGSLFSVVVSDKGKSIIRLKEDGTTNTVFGPTYLDIHSINVKNNLVFFSTSFGYKEDIFACDINTKKVYRQTQSEFGATDPIINSQSTEIYFSNFSSSGYFAARASIDTSISTILPNINDDIITLRLRDKEKFNIDSVSIPNNSYPVKKYSRFKNLISIHSWAPFYFDPNKVMAGQAVIKPGVTIFSQNPLGSSVLVAGYGYDKSSITHVSYQYYGLFPVIAYEFNLSNQTPDVFYIRGTKPPSVLGNRNESVISVYTPLILSSSSFSTYLYPYIQVINSNDYFFSVKDTSYHKGLTRFNYRLYFSSTKNLSEKSIRPRLGIKTEFNYENAPFNRENFGSIFSGDFLVYLPGINRTHSILVRHGFQNQDLERHYFSNKINFPRGYEDFYSEKFRLYTFEYLLPIAYPDFAIGSLAYLNRISLNGFYDYAYNHFHYDNKSYSHNMKSFGYEVYIDLKLFRTRYPIRIMFQHGWTGSNLLPFYSFTYLIDFYGQ